MNLLIVDDEYMIREGLKSIDWKSIKVNVVGVVENGIEAAEMIQSEEVDIVLTDIRMPGMGGIELAQFLKKNAISAKVILLTGYDDFTYAKSAISLGVFDYILKPTDPDEILSCVDRAIEAIQKEQVKNNRLKLLEKEIQTQRLIRDSEKIIMGKGENSKKGIKNILTYIDKHYNEDISLATLSDYTHFSTIYLSKLIKKHTNHTFLEILTAIRMDRAEKMLKEGSLKIYEICDKIGIADQRYFSQVFKKAYGITPNEYKKSNNNMTDLGLGELIKKIDGENNEK